MKREINSRDSNIELLKIVAIILVIICHTVQRFRDTPNILIEYKPFFDNLLVSFSQLDGFGLFVFRCFGHLGNAIFIICSSWFLIEKKESNYQKIIKFIMDIFIVSIIFLLVYKLLNYNIPSSYIIQSIFPFTFTNNWYITCYVLFYLLCPLLSVAVNNIQKNTLRNIVIIFFVLYFGICFVTNSDYYYSSKLMTFITIFLFVSYCKLYRKDLIDNKKICRIILLITVFFQGLLLFVKYFFIEFDAQLYDLKNPLIIIAAFSIFNLFRLSKIRSNKTINYISKLSLLVYIVHDNLLFRNLTLIEIVRKTVETTGNNLILIKVIVLALLLYVFALLIAFVYDKTISKITSKCSKRIINFVKQHDE